MAVLVRCDAQRSWEPHFGAPMFNARLVRLQAQHREAYPVLALSLFGYGCAGSELWRIEMRWDIAVAVSAVLGSPAFANDGELHTFHCLHGCPLGAPGTNDTIVREIYTLSSNDLTKMADWVAYRKTPETIGTSEGRDWQTDPALAADETLTEESYKDAPASLHIDRGHQAPLASFSGTQMADQTNILSNITPQGSALNQSA